MAGVEGDAEYGSLPCSRDVDCAMACGVVPDGGEAGANTLTIP